MEHYVILHNQVPRYVHRDLCYAAMAKYVALHNATYLAIATVFGPKNQELLMSGGKHVSGRRISRKRRRRTRREETGIFNTLSDIDDGISNAAVLKDTTYQ